MKPDQKLDENRPRAKLTLFTPKPASNRDAEDRPKETAGVSSVPQIARPEKPSRESERSPSKPGDMHFIGSIRESSAPAEADQNSGKRFRVTLIREGMGNLSDCFYYTAGAIQSCVGLFEGKKCFVDHPANSEEADRPERSVKDIIGHFENVSAQQDATGRLSLMGDLVLLTGPHFDRYRTLMLECLAYSQKYPEQDLVGLSINASGDFETVALEQFLKTEQVPSPCLEKLNEAAQRGITMIRPVREMRSAVSCDLVTEAGAGGSIDQLLEQEKRMSKKIKESSEQESKKTEAGSQPAPGQDGAAPAGTSQKQDDGSADDQGGQPSPDEDRELIMSMLSKYLGNGFTDDDHQMMAEAYQNAKEMGLEGKEAEDMAGHSMKMSKHLQMKQAGQGAGNPQGVANPPAPSAKDQTQESKDVKESSRGTAAQSEVVRLSAENARLQRELDGVRLREHTEKVLRESRLPMSATKKFRECIKDAKSIKEVDSSFAIFKEAFLVGGEADGMGFILGAEKQADVGTGSLSFADCVEE